MERSDRLSKVTLSTGKGSRTSHCGPHPHAEWLTLPYHVGGTVQVPVGGRARGHLAAIGRQGEVDDAAQALAILVLHSLSAGCHGYLSICPPIWRGWSLGRHPGKKNHEGKERERGKELAIF